MLRYNLNTKYGELVMSQTTSEGVKNYKILICWGHCLAVFLHPYTDENGVKMVQLYNFWNDATHVKNIMKNCGGLCPSYEEFKNIRLNMFYKESETLLKIFTKAGYKVTAYYKEIKNKKNNK